jgi:hypothetical protein
MDHIGIDVHTKESQICILAEGGDLIERRIRTEPHRFAEALSDRAAARILVESSTESEWVARCREALGITSSWPVSETREGTWRRPYPWEPACGCWELMARTCGLGRGKGGGE